MDINRSSFTSNVVNSPASDPPPRVQGSQPILPAKDAKSQPPVASTRYAAISPAPPALSYGEPVHIMQAPMNLPPQLQNALSTLTGYLQPSTELGPEARQTVIHQLQCFAAQMAPYSQYPPILPASSGLLASRPAAISAYSQYSLAPPLSHAAPQGFARMLPPAHMSRVPPSTYSSMSFQVQPLLQLPSLSPVPMSTSAAPNALSTAAAPVAPPTIAKPGPVRKSSQSSGTSPTNSQLQAPGVVRPITPVFVRPTTPSISINSTSSINSTPSAMDISRLTSTSTHAADDDDDDEESLGNSQKRARTSPSSEMQLLAWACEQARTASPEGDDDGADVSTGSVCACLWLWLFCLCIFCVPASIRLP